MADNAKATFSLADGTVHIEGSEAFVTGCIARLTPERQEPGASRHLLEGGIDHAWQWFSLHATHRMQAVDFFLVASAFLSAAYVSALRFTHPMVAAGVAALGIWFSICFYHLGLRIRELLRAGEAALAPAQRVLAELTGVPAFKICDRVENPERPHTAYSRVITKLTWVTSVGFGLGIIYAVYVTLRNHGASGARDELLLLVTYRSLVVLAAMVVLYWAQRLVAQNRATMSLFQSVTALALAGAGVIALVVSAIRPLR